MLTDQDAVRTGWATERPGKHYDLGHRYFSYDFFDQCPHRLAFARCAVYVTNASSKALLLEGKAKLLRLRQESPLTADDLRAGTMASPPQRTGGQAIGYADPDRQGSRRADAAP